MNDWNRLQKLLTANLREQVWHCEERFLAKTARNDKLCVDSRFTSHGRQAKGRMWNYRYLCAERRCSADGVLWTVRVATSRAGSGGHRRFGWRADAPAQRGWSALANFQCRKFGAAARTLRDWAYALFDYRLVAAAQCAAVYD